MSRLLAKPDGQPEAGDGVQPQVGSPATIKRSQSDSGSPLSTSQKRVYILVGVLGFMVVAGFGGWWLGSRIESPAEAAARTAPPTPSPILVPVEERILSSNIVTRGTARFGLPQPVAVAPSVLKAGAGLITTLPLRNKQIDEGEVLLTASGRPVFALQGDIPAYRDLVPGISGNDVMNLESALARLGFDPGPIDGSYDLWTSRAVGQWYESAGWLPFGPTPEQLRQIRALERDWGDAAKHKLATANAAAAAALNVESARATTEHNDRRATAELEARIADRPRLMVTEENGIPLSVESARAKAEHANRAAAADIEAKIAERAMIALDPRQPASARAAADARLELARAHALNTKLEGELAVQAAEREASLAAEQFELAESAVKSARVGGKMAVQGALDAQGVAEFEAKLAADRANQLASELEAARRKLGLQLPVDEVVFLPALPVRVQDITVVVGDPARGPVMSVTDNQLAIDSALPLDAAQLVKPGMTVAIDEQALGISATGTVSMVAATPGTRGVDGYHIYFEVRVGETKSQLEGFSVRLTIPIESTDGAVTAVPISAVSLAADGTSRIQVQSEGALEYVVVEPGLSADGYVEVTPRAGALNPGQLVVVGYENPESS